MIDSSDIGDYEFTSSSTVAELKFDVVNMTATDDFRTFGFEASVEFVRLESQCKDPHHLKGASGELNLVAELDGAVHVAHTSSQVQSASQNRLTDPVYVSIKLFHHLYTFRSNDPSQGVLSYSVKNVLIDILTVVHMLRSLGISKYKCLRKLYVLSLLCPFCAVA